MEALGRHFLLELGACSPAILDDLARIEALLLKAARKAKAHIVESHFHRFSPFGISGVVVIAESHLTIHTWPEHDYAAVDIFSCGETLEPVAAMDYLVVALQSKKPSMLELRRGPFVPKGGEALRTGQAATSHVP